MLCSWWLSAKIYTTYALLVFCISVSKVLATNFSSNLILILNLLALSIPYLRAEKKKLECGKYYVIPPKIWKWQKSVSISDFIENQSGNLGMD